MNFWEKKKKKATGILLTCKILTNTSILPFHYPDLGDNWGQCFNTISEATMVILLMQEALSCWTENGFFVHCCDSKLLRI